jgi:hypothetical protein
MKIALGLLVMAAGAAQAAPAIPAFGNLAKLNLEQKQGHAALRCNGIAYEMHFDLKAGTWDSGLCIAEPKENATTKPLTRKHGKLTDADRKKLEAAYQGLTAKSHTCGHDGGDLTLTVVEKSGAKSSFIDENWGCRKPEPPMLEGLKALMQAAGPIALYPATP